MDRYVKNFIAMSIVYLALAVAAGVLMLWDASYGRLRFVHSHLMLLGWVSMMIYGVGYHILPRFAGRLVKSPTLGEIQFWISNAGLVGLVVFHTLYQYRPECAVYRVFAVSFGILMAVSVFVFFYNMMATLYGKQKEA